MKPESRKAVPVVVIGQGTSRRTLMPGDVVKGRAIFDRMAFDVPRPTPDGERRTGPGPGGRLTRMFDDHASRLRRIDAGLYWKYFITGAVVVLAVLGPIVLALMMRGGGR